MAPAELVFQKLPSRLPLLTSFIGLFDIKIGATIITLFALLNKVAGVYGIIAVFHGGTFAQVSMYLYSLATAGLCIWGLKGVAEESVERTLTYAHLYALDHFISTVWTAFFAIVWYVYDPHDGRRIANSDAQRELMGEGTNVGQVGGSDPEARAMAAQAVWREERAFSGFVILIGWFVRIYFILCLYSFAIHVRRGTYSSLPLSDPPPPVTASSNGTAHKRPNGSTVDNRRMFEAQADQEDEVGWNTESKSLSLAAKLRAVEFADSGNFSEPDDDDDDSSQTTYIDRQATTGTWLLFEDGEPASQSDREALFRDPTLTYFGGQFTSYHYEPFLRTHAGQCPRCTKDLNFVGAIAAPLNELTYRTLLIAQCASPQCVGQDDGGLFVWRITRQIGQEAQKPQLDEPALNPFASALTSVNPFSADSSSTFGNALFGDNPFSATPASKDAAPGPSESAVAMTQSTQSTQLNKPTRWGIAVWPMSYCFAMLEPPVKAAQSKKKEPKAYLDDHPDPSSKSASESYEVQRIQGVDSVFLHFQDVLSRQPSQFIRYEYAGKPLPYSSTSPAYERYLVKASTGSQGMTTVTRTAYAPAAFLPGAIAFEAARAPLCEQCGAQRVFEAQLMPALCTWLRTKLILGWSTAWIFTCSGDCAAIALPGGTTFSREHVTVEFEI
ncbi:uncharacterized protein L969DRAFT_95993 [Mixia osmundae IAM 14324]|uniref:Programmed cell death protein 2 C-terminal domain-containing protein n=1 Tax=Mixia osmundae (strain CBS 9802 / IAM 14324 / JCM 22182 / KY 12970) TaxID=764103 RepID=G7DWT3_MIXOS|nr:uncharacterized protein L969DRAFT_613710 [Mixia osmundae IAM 14324]XP_014566723.1 uncharacterized protein L969DRAFT_95993 [Mixia osmundae IAM 14324]KEI36192.1 hypothetical protein L969DRAFT_613710 [Mixia osmundae IAM 14324]KEI38160.1 hypothetical protein L969DRAFT_95993 [Mixia osmundae IAM 14324]GAA95030.1 hypothetical protein E5Q_01685 [Mixia osmundae IAM 14324]